ncbi:hypothetical protein DZK25_08740 [Wenzhouxiangella sp. 15181]|nr:hypothetical protein DZK25_08740 [Wenzhouxiangella sp. 15181]RFP69283.1 hypothetical protein DZK26_04680 [Wenzhouxiangella sp. 15190]
MEFDVDRLERVEGLMEDFANRTGLDGTSVPKRYLWTDAFAVCNYLSLRSARGEQAFLDRARLLVDQVHEVLGAYAEHDPRSGWLGGMDDREHSRAPTRAGLRIGKQLSERGPGDAFDERREWDRDGQYFHYLTRWMHALERMAEATDEARYHRWAVDLAFAAFDGFVHRSPDGPPRIFWKMSIDLDRPLVPSMGHHDPLDGWVMAQVLMASDHGTEAERRELARRAGIYREMFAGRDMATGDALGIGGLLVDAWQLYRVLPVAEDIAPARVAELVDAAGSGLDLVVGQRQLEARPEYRLAFRELGLATGLRAAGRLAGCAQSSSRVDPGRLEDSLASISDRLPLADDIERTWLRRENRKFPAWTDHRDINDVMLATCLAPAGYLGPAPHGESQTEVTS